MQSDNPVYPLASILFDESHSESWSISKDKAIEMKASHLSRDTFKIQRVMNNPRSTLSGQR